MLEAYFTLVINKRRTCDVKNLSVKQVPNDLKDGVIKLLTDRGYDLNGNKL